MRAVRGFWAVLCTCALLAGCGDKSPQAPPPPDTGGVPSGTEKITGTERVGWDQQAGSSEELSTFRYLIYVDANPTDAQDVSCTATPGPSGYSCSSRLPPMSAGQHSLSLSSYITSSGNRLESERSTSLLVVLIAQTTSAAASGSLSVTTTDGVQLAGTVVANGLIEPTALASAPDGRVFIAERNGRIRVFHDGGLQVGRNITLPDTTTKDGQGLLALAVDPDYERNHFVYAVYTTVSGFRLARLRAVGDTLGEHAVLLDRIPSAPSQPAAAIRFGTDGKLYVAFDDAGQPRRAGDLGSFNGKVLRLNTDGTTPTDQAGGSPIYASNVNTPRGIDWDPSGSALWVADAAAEGVLSALGGRPVITRARYTLPGNANASALTIYRGAIKPFQGNLLVAANSGHSLLRLRVDAVNPMKILSSEQILGDAVEQARAITVDTDGAIFVATNDSLIKLAVPRQ